MILRQLAGRWRRILSRFDDLQRLVRNRDARWTHSSRGRRNSLRRRLGRGSESRLDDLEARIRWKRRRDRRHLNDRMLGHCRTRGFARRFGRDALRFERLCDLVIPGRRSDGVRRFIGRVGGFGRGSHDSRGYLDCNTGRFARRFALQRPIRIGDQRAGRFGGRGRVLRFPIVPLTAVAPLSTLAAPTTIAAATAPFGRFTSCR